MFFVFVYRPSNMHNKRHTKSSQHPSKNKYRPSNMHNKRHSKSSQRPSKNKSAITVSNKIDLGPILVNFGRDLALKSEPNHLAKDPELVKIPAKEQKMKQNWLNLYNDGLLPYWEKAKMMNWISKLQMNPTWRRWLG